MTIAEIATIIGGSLSCSGKSANLSINGFSTDTRTLKKGDLFIALKGTHYDGNNFLSSAIQSGACGAIVSRVDCSSNDYPIPIIIVKDTLEALQLLASSMRKKHSRALVVAVTGSVGKTTTKEMIGEIVKCGGNAVITKENKNNHIGLPLTLLEITDETDFVVLEMGCNNFGEIASLTKIADPDIGLITCVAPVHTEFLGDESGVAKAKGELFETMREDSVAVVNLDDRWISKMPVRSKNKITYSTSGSREIVADVKLLEAYENEKNRKQRITLDLCGKKIDLELSLPGIHNAKNATAAAATAFSAGIEIDKICEGLSNVRAIQGRGLIIEKNNIKIIDESYNSSPLALNAALNVIRNLSCNGRKVVITGDMLELGDKAEEYHRIAGKKIAEVADLLITVGNFGKNLSDGAISSGMNPSKILSFKNSSEAVQELRKNSVIKKGDVVLVKGSRAIKMDIIVKMLIQDDVI